jgi:hypothetical protein
VAQIAREAPQKDDTLGKLGDEVPPKERQKEDEGHLLAQHRGESEVDLADEEEKRLEEADFGLLRGGLRSRARLSVVDVGGRAIRLTVLECPLVGAVSARSGRKFVGVVSCDGLWERDEVEKVPLLSRAEEPLKLGYRREAILDLEQ